MRILQRTHSSNRTPSGFADAQPPFNIGMIATGNHNFERFAALCNTLPGEAWALRAVGACANRLVILLILPHARLQYKRPNVNKMPHGPIFGVRHGFISLFLPLRPQPLLLQSSRAADGRRMAPTAPGGYSG